jgi:phospholipid/cholesterol/gamma-HCH transport system substrate-binding protein
MTNNIVEVIVGAVVLVTAACFVFFSMQDVEKGFFTSDQYMVYAKFRTVDGLVVGDDIRVSGVKVGTISRLYLDKTESYYAVADMMIRNGVILPVDTSAKIVSAGLMGNSYVSLELGAAEAIIGVGSEIIHTQGAIGILDLIGRAISR